jgi:hypothetical protein
MLHGQDEAACRRDDGCNKDCKPGRRMKSNSIGGSVSASTHNQPGQHTLQQQAGPDNSPDKTRAFKHLSIGDDGSGGVAGIGVVDLDVVRVPCLDMCAEVLQTQHTTKTGIMGPRHLSSMRVVLLWWICTDWGTTELDLALPGSTHRSPWKVLHSCSTIKLWQSAIACPS